MLGVNSNNLVHTSPNKRTPKMINQSTLLKHEDREGVYKMVFGVAYNQLQNQFLVVCDNRRILYIAAGK